MLFAGPPFELTSREIDVLRLVIDGLTNTEAAERLSLSPRTVEVHRYRVLSCCWF